MNLLSPSFFGAFLGSIAGLLALIGIILLWDYLQQRKERQRQQQQPQKIAPVEQILERHIEQYLLTHFSELFKGWQIFNGDAPTSSDASPAHPPLGVRYRTKAGEIDFLCIDPKGNFVVIELKRDKAPDRVVAQVDRYIAWVKKHLAQPNQRVYGLIIAKRFDQRLFHTLQRRRDIKIWTYRWHLRLNKRPTPDE